MSNISILDHLIKVVADERLALKIVQEQSIEQCVPIVNIIAQCKGKVVVSGVGKSAIIANKIAATFNSTGTNALYMHAADAIHGDLGVVTDADIVICISKSGDTDEFKALLPILKAMNVETISMTCNEQSYLHQQSNHTILLPSLAEADPNGLAPTTSTTMQLVIGDALAISVMQFKGFTKQDFAKYHPGGSLGRQLYTKVADIYHQLLEQTVSPDQDVQHVILSITKGRVGATVVLKNDEIKGVITDGDLRRAMLNRNDFTNVTAKEIMNTNPKTIEIDSLAANAFNVMKSHNINQLVVLEANKYLGFIHIQDLIKIGFY